MIVTGFIAHVGYEVTGELVHHLTDGVDPDILAQAEQAALGVAASNTSMSGHAGWDADCWSKSTGTSRRPRPSSRVN